MIKFFLIILFFVFFTSSFANEIFGEIKGCGTYKIAGIIRKDPQDGVHLVVNEKTASEYQLKPAQGELPSFVGNIDIPITMKVKIIKLDGTHGVISTPTESKLLIPNPLNPKKNSGFILLNKNKCE